MPARLLSVLGVVILLSLWFALAQTHFVSPLLIPPPGEVLSALITEACISGDIWSDLGATVQRTLFSFGIASLIGVPVGLVLGLVPVLYRSSSFLLDFFRSIPPIVFLPILMLAFGLGEITHLAVAVYGATLVIMINAAYGVIHASDTRRMVAKLYGLTALQIVYKVVLPEAAPQTLVGMRTALSLVLVLTIVVELILGTQGGIGKRIHDNQLLFNTASMYVSILFTGALGYVLNVGFVSLERSLLHWVDK